MWRINLSHQCAGIVRASAPSSRLSSVSLHQLQRQQQCRRNHTTGGGAAGPHSTEASQKIEQQASTEKKRFQPEVYVPPSATSTPSTSAHSTSSDSGRNGFSQPQPTDSRLHSQIPQATGIYSNPRSQFYSDLSRVLVGLSLVFDHGSSMAMNSVSDHLSTLRSQNEKNLPRVDEVTRIVKEAMQRAASAEPHAAQSQADAPPANGAATDFTATEDGSGTSARTESSTSGFSADLLSQLPKPPQSFQEVPNFVQQSVGVASNVASATLNQLKTKSSASTSAVVNEVVNEVRHALKHQNQDVVNEVAKGAVRMQQQFEQVGKQVQQIFNQPLPRAPAAEEAAPTSAASNMKPASGSPEVINQPALNTATAPITPISPPAAELPSVKKQVYDTNVNAALKANIPQTPVPSASTTSVNDTLPPPPSSPVTPSAATTAAMDASSTSASPSFTTFNSGAASTFQPRERTVPASPLARIAGFSQIGANIFFGTIKDKVTGVFAGSSEEANEKDAGGAAIASGAAPQGINVDRATSGMMSSSSSSTTSSAASSGSSVGAKKKSSTMLNSFLSEANTERLAEGLCRMRGAALKVGQMLSIQDESLVPPQLQAVLDRVRDGADVMPRAQLEKALTSELGPNWQDQLSEFDWKPMAAASIGQVHRARLKSNNQEIVMKVQYPGVAESINSDVNNLKRLIRFVNVLPKGMYIDETMKAAKEELALECDYSNEALAQKKFKKLAGNDKSFYIPNVIDSLSTKRILTTERIYGVAIDRLVATAPTGHAGSDKIVVSEATRNYICKSLLRLCLNELFNYRFMQTDPNWSNFLYNPHNNMIYLIDFGASRLYRKQFVDEYLRMVYACSIRDRKGIINSSIKLGFLTGDESKEMLDAHVAAGEIIGEPFSSDTPYDFVQGNIAARVSALAAVMLKHRLTAPPKEAYTLHRKLSGAFLTCRKLEAKVHCKDDFLNVYRNHPFGPELPLEFGSASKDPIESRLTKAD